MQEVIWLHHLAPDTLPTSVAMPRLIALINLADTIAREQRLGYSGNYVFYEGSAQIARHVGLLPADLAAAVQTLVADVAEQGELLGLNHETPEELYVESMTRANSELGRLNEELLASNRRLAVAARYFEAIGQFGQQLNAWLDLPAVVTAIARASTVALQRSRVAAFGLRAGNVAVDISWVSRDPDEQDGVTEDVPGELAEWLSGSSDVLNLVLTRAPRAIRALMV